MHNFRSSPIQRLQKNYANITKKISKKHTPKRKLFKNSSKSIEFSNFFAQKNHQFLLPCQVQQKILSIQLLSFQRINKLQLSNGGNLPYDLNMMQNAIRKQQQSIKYIETKKIKQFKLEYIGSNVDLDESSLRNINFQQQSFQIFPVKYNGELIAQDKDYFHINKDDFDFNITTSDSNDHSHNNRIQNEWEHIEQISDNIIFINGKDDFDLALDLNTEI